MRSVRVDHAGGSYEVRIGSGLMLSLPARITQLAPRAKRVVTVQDRNAPAEPILEAGAQLMATHEQQVIMFEPTEADKSLAWHAEILRRLAADGTQRTDVVVAYGGGITGDLAGFAAASYRRGMGVIQCPTTLLAMVDASVGGKTGVNLTLEGRGLLKNMVGAFHQPLEVIADIDTLQTLDDRTFSSGMAECIKHGLIAGGWSDPGLLAWTHEHTDRILAREPAVLEELVERNVAVKARVVASDEKELSTGASGRQLLNLGHTFAHAFEPVDGLGPDGGLLTHGEAVGLGLLAASSCATSQGLVPSEHGNALRETLEAFRLPTALPTMANVPSLVARMHHDKKAAGGTLRVVLPDAESTARVVDNPGDDALAAAIDSIRAT